jgi:tRNA(fMet)-specific endonuclease VapC
VDTNVFSYLLTENALGARYASLLAECVLCLSFVTPEESFYGADRRNWGARRRRELEAHIAGCILLPMNLEIARISGRLRADRERCGRPLSHPDAWIAATALWYGLPAVSHDRDLLGIDGLRVIATGAAPTEEPSNTPERLTAPAEQEVITRAYFFGVEGTSIH